LVIEALKGICSAIAAHREMQAGVTGTTIVAGLPVQKQIDQIVLTVGRGVESIATTTFGSETLRPPE
jgi:hypothetical protein